MTAVLRYFNICLFLLLSGSITSTMSAWAEDRENNFSFLQKKQIIVACIAGDKGNTCTHNTPRSNEEICKKQCNTSDTCKGDICKDRCSNHCEKINSSNTSSNKNQFVLPSEQFCKNTWCFYSGCSLLYPYFCQKNVINFPFHWYR